MRAPSKALIVILALSWIQLLTGCERDTRKKTMAPPKVTVVKPVQQEVTRYLEYTGTSAALEYVEIRARVTGFLEKVCFEPRAKVKAGDLLFLIDPRQFQAEADEAQAKLDANKAQSKLAQTEVQIAQQLETKEAISALKLEKKASERDVAVSDVNLATAALQKAKLNLEWTRVTSPIKGRVSRNLVDVGNLVGMADKTVLTTVVDDERVYVYFSVSELDALTMTRARSKGDFKSPAEVRIPVYMALADETEYVHEGYIDFADTKIDPSTGTLQVRGIFPNPDGLLMAGMFMRVRVPTDKRLACLVPEVALQADQGGSYCLLVTSDNTVEQRRVKPGMTVGAMRVIDRGLEGKESVIVGGLQRARPGAKVSPASGEAGAAAAQGPPGKPVGK